MRKIDNEMVAEPNMVLHLKKSDSYFSRCILLAGMTEGDFEEITAEEYAKIVEEREEEFGDVVGRE